MNQEQALALAFPTGSTVERKSLFLDEKTTNEVQKAAKSKLESRLVNYYVGKSTTGPGGYAFFSTHVVRTMPETIMIVVNPDGSLRFVEILAFYEPEDYRPPKRWLGLFSNKKLDNDLWVKRGIRNITGATLTTQAITEAVRRALATYEIAIQGKEVAP